MALLVACHGGVEPGGIAFDGYVLEPGPQLVFTPLGEPTGDEISLARVDGTPAWEIRQGSDWEDGAVLEQLPVEESAGVRVDGTLLLPPTLRTGERTEGVTVESLGEVETWYGTFPDAVALTVASDSRWDGPAAFASGLGPVSLTLDGTTWDLVTYTP